MKPNLLFLTLKVFCETGGIEKVSRVAGKALFELSVEHQFAFSMYAAYDVPSNLDSRYVPARFFTGFGGSKHRFVLKAIQTGRKADVVLISHVNLLSVGYAIKRLSPRTKLVLLAHGIEVWRPMPAWRRRMLDACDLILPVSQFTKNKMRELYAISEKKFRVINNCLDPFLPPLSSGEKSPALLRRYGLKAQHKILLTLTRLSFKERYKGYDEVLMAIKALKKTTPALRYLVVGKYDELEKQRLDRMILQQGLAEQVIFAGYVPESELADHFGLADVYVMPSRKEGFGIVFIEALYYGKPVIAGNVDGSVDALANGALGLLINPDRPEEVLTAIERILNGRAAGAPDPAQVYARFGYPVYKEALLQAIQPLLLRHRLAKETEDQKKI